jgi:YD repeat-containing protein
MDPAATRLVLESRSYDPAGQLASVIDAMGRETAYTYLDDGSPDTKRLVRRDATGAVTSSTLLAQYEYDYGGKLIRETDAAGVVHDYDYDDMGNRYRETLDPAGLARTTSLTFNANGSVASRTDDNGVTFLTGRTAEKPYLFADNGSQLDGTGDRYADKTATFTYKFSLPADAVTGALSLEIDNQYLIQLSSDNTNWTEVDRETRAIQNGSNRATRTFPLDSYLSTSKTVYLRIGDSQPADGWGGALSRVGLNWTRAGGIPMRATFGYDAGGRQTSSTVANPGGTPSSLVTKTDRDPRGLITAMTDPSGGLTTKTYDAVGDPATTAGPARAVWRDGVRTDGFVPVVTAGRNTFGDLTDYRDTYGAVTRSEYDGMGRRTKLTMPPYTPPGGSTISPTATAKYNTTGQPLTQTDPLGRVTTFGYDPYGRASTRTDPDPDGSGPQTSPFWTYSYDRDGELLDTTDPTGAHASATYNDLGYAVTATRSERVNATTAYFTTTLGRDDAGRLVSEKTPLGNTTTHEYDPAGALTKTTDPVGRTVETRYDAIGHVTATIVAGARATGYAYDGAGRQIRQTSHNVSGRVLSAPLRTQQTAYDPLGRPVTVTSAEGRLTTYAYDAGGNKVSVTQRANPADPATAVTAQIGYDALGHPTRLVDGNGNATDYLYNDWGLRTVVREPPVLDGGAGTWTTVYDAAGQAVRLVEPGGVIQDSTFDGLGRITAQSGSGAAQPTTARSIQYDPDGRPTRISSPASDATFTWNDRGLLAASTGPVGPATFGYDGEDHLTSRSDPTGSAIFTYDTAGRPATASDPLTGHTQTMGYGPTGELASISYGTGGPRRTMTTDDIGRLATDTLATASGTTAASATYSYDRDDLLTTRTTTGTAGAGSNGYGHDGLGRLATWTRPDGQQTGYGYDAGSNRTTVTGPGGTRTYTYDARNRLMTGTGGGTPDLTQTWSARGTLETSTSLTRTVQYGYDAFDRPVVMQAAGHSDTYTYDALDRLAQRNGAAFGYVDPTNDAVSAPTAAGNALIFRAPDGTPLSDRAGTGPGRMLTTDGVHGDLVAAADPASHRGADRLRRVRPRRRAHREQRLAVPGLPGRLDRAGHRAGQHRSPLVQPGNGVIHHRGQPDPGAGPGQPGQPLHLRQRRPGHLQRPQRPLSGVPGHTHRRGRRPARVGLRRGPDRRGSDRWRDHLPHRRLPPPVPTVERLRFIFGGGIGGPAEQCQPGGAECAQDGGGRLRCRSGRRRRGPQRATRRARRRKPAPSV